MRNLDEIPLVEQYLLALQGFRDYIANPEMDPEVDGPYDCGWLLEALSPAGDEASEELRKTLVAALVTQLANPTLCLSLSFFLLEPVTFASSVLSPKWYSIVGSLNRMQAWRGLRYPKRFII
jgi:hypothetical protein